MKGYQVVPAEDGLPGIRQNKVLPWRVEKIRWVGFIATGNRHGSSSLSDVLLEMERRHE